MTAQLRWPKTNQITAARTFFAVELIHVTLVQMLASIKQAGRNEKAADTG
jgi:hypothetical protein